MAQATPLAVISFADISDNFEWYTVVTRFNYEAKFANELLEKLNKNRELLDYFEDLFIPERKCTVEYKNVKGHTSKRIITDKTMSLYVFVKAKMTEHIYWQLREITGCASILSTGSMLITLTDEEIKKRRDDAFIHETTMKNMFIINKVNPYHNPILALKDINNELNPSKLIVIDKSDLEEESIISNNNLLEKKDNIASIKDTSTKLNQNNDNKDVYMKRTKAESLPGIDDINPRLFLKRLQKLTLTKKFFELTGKDVSFMSDSDLERFKTLIKETQREISTPKVVENNISNYSSTINTRQHTSSKNRRVSSRKLSDKPKYTKSDNGGKKQNNSSTLYESNQAINEQNHLNASNMSKVKLPYKVIRHQNHVEDNSTSEKKNQIIEPIIASQSHNKSIKKSTVVKSALAVKKISTVSVPIESTKTNNITRVNQSKQSEQLKQLRQLKRLIISNNKNSSHAKQIKIRFLKKKLKKTASKNILRRVERYQTLDKKK